MDSNRIARLAQGVRDALRADIASNLDRVLRPDSAERLARPGDVERVERLAKADPDALVERIAYTWFNRLCALRFMDAKGYTPVGCVTAREGESLPAILADARQGVLHPEFPMPEDDRAQVLGLLDGSRQAADPLGDAYALLLLSACAAYQDPMGYLFGGSLEERNAMRLLHPTNLTADDGILARIVSGMNDKACESVEVLGWLYQFYIAERHDEWYASKKKAGPKDIAAATELFTPDWIVRYLAENSLGRLWMLNNPDSELSKQMDYYIAPEQGEEGPFIEVDGPEGITVCDPACGSGHILVYAFDLLFRMYEEEGYMDEEIPALILQDNLYGMEIDPRAAEIASFALEMKSREKDPGFFQKDVDPHITVLEPITFTAQELQGIALAENHGLLDAFEHLTECGSLYTPKPKDLRDVEEAIKAADGRKDLFAADTLDKLERMKADLETLSKQYDCVIANPPYLGNSKLDPWANDWVKQNYPDEKKDLCTCFISRCLSLVHKAGYASVITSDTCMYISSFETMRQKLIEQKTIVSLIDTRGSNAHPDVFDANAGWVLCNAPAEGSRGSYFKLNQSISDKAAALKEAIKNPECGWFYRADQQDFKSVPGWPIAYWISESMLNTFKEERRVSEYGRFSVGIKTGDNSTFLRLWWEVGTTYICDNADDYHATYDSSYKWFPCNKGGAFRKWYGNNNYVVDWRENGRFVFEGARCNGHYAQNYAEELQFRPYISWSDITSAEPSFRFKNHDLSEMTGMGLYPKKEDIKWLLGLLNSSIVNNYVKLLSPTLHLKTREVGNIPCKRPVDTCAVDYKVELSIDIAKVDWDSFETSWDFTFHPLAQYGEPLISNQFARWSSECRKRFDALKANEEELNRIFARIYHMEGEVPIEVPEDKVSVRLADEERDVRSLISYGIGCIFGRYSTDRPGLILADAGQTTDDFRAKVPESGFAVDEDAVLPVIALEDVSLPDDIVRRFEGWLRYVYGDDSFEENRSYIEGVLGKDLRAYFAKDFYKDHCDTYSVVNAGKRPIYWMFSSPKGSFQALVYMHRMNRDTVSTVLTEYVRPFRQRLLAQIGVLRASGAARDVTKADKYQAMVAELEGWERCSTRSRRGTSRSTSMTA